VGNKDYKQLIFRYLTETKVNTIKVSDKSKGLGLKIPTTHSRDLWQQVMKSVDSRKITAELIILYL